MIKLKESNLAQMLSNDVAESEQLDVKLQVFDGLAVYQDLGDVVRNQGYHKQRVWRLSILLPKRLSKGLTHDACDWLHLEGRANRNQEVNSVTISRHSSTELVLGVNLLSFQCVVELVRQTLAEKDNVRLHHVVFSLTEIAAGNLLVKDVFSDGLAVHLVSAAQARGGGKGAMTLDHVGDARYVLEGVDVLGVVPEELPLLFNLLDEKVGGRGDKIARVDLLGKGEEGLRVPPEILDVKHGLWLGKGEFIPESLVDAIL